MSAHVLTDPERLRYPGGKDGFYQVRCSCGYVTAPNAYPGKAEAAAAEHKRAKDALHQDMLAAWRSLQ